MATTMTLLTQNNRKTGKRQNKTAKGRKSTRKKSALRALATTTRTADDANRPNKPRNGNPNRPRGKKDKKSALRALAKDARTADDANRPNKPRNERKSTDPRVSQRQSPREPGKRSKTRNIEARVTTNKLGKYPKTMKNPGIEKAQKTRRPKN